MQYYVVTKGCDIICGRTQGHSNFATFIQVQKIRNSLAAVVAPEAVVVPQAVVEPGQVVVPEQFVVPEEAGAAVPVPWQHQDEDPSASADRLREIEKSLELIAQEARQGQQYDIPEDDESFDNSFDVSTIKESSEFVASVDGLTNNEFIDIDSIDDGYVSGDLYFLLCWLCSLPTSYFHLVF